MKSSKKIQEEQLRGAGLVGIGIGTSVGGGLLSGRGIVKGRARRKVAFGLGKGTGMAGAMAGAEAFKKVKRSRRFARRSAFIAQLVGGAFIGEGITKLAKSSGFKDSDTTGIVSGLAGEIAAFGVGAGIKRVTKGTSIRKSFQTGIRKAAKFVINRKLKF